MKKLLGLAFPLFFTLLLALSLDGGAARADKQETEFDVHVGDAFLQSLGEPAGTVARASNGDTIKVIFTGEIESGDRE